MTGIDILEASVTLMVLALLFTAVHIWEQVTKKNDKE